MTLKKEETPKMHPHPSIIAAREALAKKPPAPLEHVLEQIEKAAEWRRNY